MASQPAATLIAAAFFPVMSISATALMTKADLIQEVAQATQMTRKDSEFIVETIFDSIIHSLQAGDKIEIRGFGSFRTHEREARVGRNPKTGERVQVPARRIPRFKASKELKDGVNAAAIATPPSEPHPA